MHDVMWTKGDRPMKTTTKRPAPLPMPLLDDADRLSAMATALGLLEPLAAAYVSYLRGVARLKPEYARDLKLAEKALKAARRKAARACRVGGER
jgi:hypothetical protein